MDSSRQRTSSRLLLLAPAVCLLLSAAACYVIPLKLALGAQASYYLFGYGGDEYTYAYRIQPLLPGAKATNPVNAVADDRVISPFYLEDLCRLFVRATGMQAITFFWLWRFAFPLALIGGMAALIFNVMPPRSRRWSWLLSCAVAAASVPVLLVAYDLVIRFPPFQGWIFRIPTNIEYLLSIVVAVAAVRFERRPSPSSALALAVAMAVLAYLRFYTAIPWLMALAAMGAGMLLSRRLEARSAAVLAGSLAVFMAPWLSINLWNSSIDTFQQLIERYFGSPPWVVSPFWPIYLVAGTLLAAAAAALPSAERALVAGCAAAVVLMSFVSGLMPFAKELHAFERTGSFYLVALLMAAGLLLAHRARRWNGFGGARRGMLLAVGISAMGMLCAAAVISRNYDIDFDAYPATPYRSAHADLRCVKGYDWVRANTPRDALFIVDDGCDWSQFKTSTELDAAWKRHTLADDLFSVVAQRARVHHIRIYGNAISDEDYKLLKALHYGTVGIPAGMEIVYRDYLRGLEKFRPAYIFWKKSAPFPRAMGVQLKKAAKTVYGDEGCEIWELMP